MTFPITAADKRACAERELAMRKRVYPRWVSAGKMAQITADREIAVMTAIADDYRVIVEAPSPRVVDPQKERADQLQTELDSVRALLAQTQDAAEHNRIFGVAA